MAILYIVSDHSGAGKTALSASLASIFSEAALTVGVITPVARPEDTDLSVYANLLGTTHDLSALTPPAESVSLDLVKKACAVAQEGKDVLVVEGASDLSLQDHTSLAVALDATVVVVVGFAAGMDTGPLAEWSIQLKDRLLGFLINGVTRYQERDVMTRLLPDMKAQGLKSLGTIPEDRKLLSVSVAQISEHLDGRYIVGKKFADGLVEHFMVGGMGMDSGINYFALHENKATIVRGDRPDIQMASLQTPTTCMVLTEGTEPIEYVLNEAELENVPIVVTESDTLVTMKAIKDIQKRARFDHPDKLARFSELLRRHADLDVIRARTCPVA